MHLVKSRSESLRPPRVDLCVISYRRPEGLTRLFGALEMLNLPDPAPALRVVVIDNDPDETARFVCRQAATWLPHPIRYVSEKRRGIPQARNTAIETARQRADFVAFLDDDEVPDPDWLVEMLGTQRDHDADAVTGPVLSLFEERPPEWIVEAGFFERPRHPDGALVHVAFTGNVLVRLRALAEMDVLFDERMALTGGSDAEFFRRFHRDGHSIVWADNALVHEVVPASRVSLGWVLRRRLRVGTSTAYVDRRHTPGAGPAFHLLVNAGWCVVKGTGQLLAGLARGRRAAAARGLALAVYGVGRCAGLAGWRYREYRVTHGR